MRAARPLSSDAAAGTCPACGAVPAAELAVPAQRPTGEAFIAASALEHAPTDPGVFDDVVSWADAMAGGATSFRGRWSSDHPLVRFAESFWLDMCRSAYGWRGVTLPSLRRCVQLQMTYDPDARTARSTVTFSAELAALMRELERWVGLTRDMYGHDPQAMEVPDDVCERQMISEHVEDVCELAGAWARSVGLTGMALEAEHAVDALRSGA